MISYPIGPTRGRVGHESNLLLGGVPPEDECYYSPTFLLTLTLPYCTITVWDVS